MKGECFEMGGNVMQISASTIDKINGLPEDKQNIVYTLVEQLSMTPMDALEKLRVQGLQNPMEMDEINEFIEETREGKC